MSDETTSTESVATEDVTAATEDVTAATEDVTQSTGDDVTTETDGNTDTSVDDASTDQTTYADFEMGEGIQLDEAALSQALPVFQEAGLTQEQAQKLVGIYSDQVQAGVQKQVDNFNQQVADWRDQAKNDSEYGGDKFDENVKIAQAAVNKLGTPELKQVLEDYGVGNHPEIIRFMVKVGKLTVEDVPGGQGTVTSKNDRVSLLYPNDRNS